MDLQKQNKTHVQNVFYYFYFVFILLFIISKCEQTLIYLIESIQSTLAIILD